ncbi:plasmid pRiA4b ORF-3 family protein [Carnobacterium mobile]|uniref:plasmid pRiA4b ORF-3 family protein n=1 Tax=Carnobacterium mobile TaxID=2750 RepID=UPI0006919114|nr:plasmid pRiA4b ORF-3 family protein [Carnobacterium mobile]
MIFQFKISLLDVGVPVWRRVQVDSHSTFRELHEVIQVAFDWYNSHLHNFSIRKSNGHQIQNISIEPDNEYQGPNSDSGWGNFASSLEILNEGEETLAKWFKKEKDRVIYTYDFGDDWEHEIVLEKILEPTPDVYYPICLKAKNDAPEENSRGELIDGDDSFLINPDAKEIVEEINDMLEEGFSDLDF